MKLEPIVNPHARMKNNQKSSKEEEKELLSEIIEKYLDKLNFYQLSMNELTFENTRMKKKEEYP